MNHSISMTPAYGRDYKSKSAALADLNNSKDFLLHEGLNMTYVNKESLVEAGITRIYVRYDRLRKVCVVALDSKTGVWK